MSDQRIFQIQRELARCHGLWVEPAGASGIAALHTLFDEGWAQPDARVVCLCSGAGFKDPYLAQKEAEQISAAPPIARDSGRIIETIRGSKADLT